MAQDDPDYDPDRGTYRAGAGGITLASLHHEMRLSFQSQAKELDEIKSDVGEARDELRAINSRLRTEERWTARGQGAIAVIGALGIGNAIVIVLGGS